MTVSHNGAKRMVASKLLAELIERLQTARADQNAALANDTKTAVEWIVTCCADTASIDHLPSESGAEAMHADLIRMGDLRLKSPATCGRQGRLRTTQPHRTLLQSR